MSKKVFQKPFAEKIVFDARDVIVTSGKICQQQVTNKVADHNVGICDSGTKSYTGLDNPSYTPGWSN